MGEWAEPETRCGLVGVVITVWAGRVPELMGGEKFLDGRSQAGPKALGSFKIGRTRESLFIRQKDWV